ncbi:MAG: helix-turn-helix transcriptional regulator [Myxococcales bacterium]|nr:MAG: helix-turn-helix transcriptional regulator [Myxococcales bacterium]
MSTKKKRKNRSGDVDATAFLKKLTGGPLTLGEALLAIRRCEERSQASFATLLRISRQHLCDLEKGRRLLSPGRAAKFAKILGYSESQFVRLALQDQLAVADLDYRVELNAA